MTCQLSVLLVSSPDGLTSAIAGSGYLADHLAAAAAAAVVVVVVAEDAVQAETGHSAS
jgi:hypothetical protein